jgi:phosphoribosylamine--glycine ligase
MRFIGVGDYCDLGALYLRLIEEGHEVKISIGNPLCHGILAGMVERVPDWRSELPWLRAAGQDGIILFENVAGQRGRLQDELRAQGFHVVGGSAYGDRLENDRAYAQRVLAEVGLPTARIWEFSERAAALDFLRMHPGRYVLKFNGPDASTANYVGRLPDGRDVAAVVRKLSRHESMHASFVLMEHLDGIEMGVGAYFDGEKFLRPACLDWEHKHFFPGDLGELTGEMGTVVTYDRSQRFFERTLGRVESLLRTHGHCGYVNLNTIVNERGIWPLEFTCRFGYPGYAILTPLQQTPWGELLAAMIAKSRPRFEIRRGFCVGIVLTTPPFPYSLSKVDEPIGLPVTFDGQPSPDDRSNLHYCEVGIENGELVTSGMYGWVMIATGVGHTIALAQQRANALADRILVPNVRYRRDIGDRLLLGEWNRLETLGLLDAKLDVNAASASDSAMHIAERNIEETVMRTAPWPSASQARVAPEEEL